MIDGATIAGYFEQYEWVAEEVETDVWRSAFTTESEDDFDVYVMLADEWIHFAISPLVHIGMAEQRPRLIAALLRLNQRLRMVRLALDDQGDLNLVADAPRERFEFGDFALILDLLTEYADALAREIERSVMDDNYFSPFLPTP